MMTTGNHSPGSRATNIGFQRFVIINSLPGTFLQNVGLLPVDRPGSLSCMMIHLLLSGVTGLAIQLESSNWSDKMNHAKSGLIHQRKFHILAHTETQERLLHFLVTNQRYSCL